MFMSHCLRSAPSPSRETVIGLLYRGLSHSTLNIWRGELEPNAVCQVWGAGFDARGLGSVTRAYVALGLNSSVYF